MIAKAPRTSLGSVSMDVLRAELNRRQHGLGKLEKQHAKLTKKLIQLERQIEANGGGAGGRGRRARNTHSLVEVLGQVLKGKTLGVPDAADAVLATGYTSNAANFRLIVNQALIKSKEFKKVSRGQYTAK